MQIIEIITELTQSNDLSDESIEQIEENNNVRIGLVRYFDENENRELALRLLKIFGSLRQDSASNISGDTLMLACYILGKHKHTEDCLIIWETKSIDFDTFCYIDIQLVVFLGVQETINFLKNHTSKSAIKALKYIEDCNETGDFDDLENYYSSTPWFI